jgi:putative tryptophan/tyrosine transport system substrate-binding protein
MKRREFITLAGGAAAAALSPWLACAQQSGKAVRIGMLSAAANMTARTGNYAAFHAQMRELGLVDGQHYVVDYHDLTARGPFVGAAEMMRGQPDLIVVTGPEAALQAVVGASRVIPVVMLAVQFDPIARGYVASVARPGGNITGVFLRQLELAGKQLEILSQTFPQRTRLAALFDNYTADQLGEAEQTAKSLNIQLQPHKLDKAPYDFDSIFPVLSRDSQMVIVFSSPFFTEHASRIAELAIAHRLPTMFTFRHYVEAGGLISYGVDFPAMFRKTAEYVVRILKGAKPADLPIEHATKFETVVNLKTAKAIGVELPTGILLRADRVIE